MDIMPHELSTINGGVLDIESDVGGIKLQSELLESERELTNIDNKRLPEVVIYQHIDFGGRSARTNLNWKYVGDWWNDKISSIVITSGVWRFYQHANYRGAYWDLGPGYYRWVEDANIPNDIISSFKVIRLTD